MDISRKRVRGEGFEGEIRTDGDYVNVGCLGGVVFDVIIDTNRGKSHLRGLVSGEKADPRMN